MTIKTIELSPHSKDAVARRFAIKRVIKRDCKGGIGISHLLKILKLFRETLGPGKKRKKSLLNFRLASLFGLGKAPVAPGTVATLIAGVPCFLAAGRFSWQMQLAFSTVVFVIGWYVSANTQSELGRIDPGEVVIDELCGYLVAMAGHPVSFVSILCGFLLFRLFDIWKPWPIRSVEKKLQGGAGIMLDDVLAGIYANVLALILLKLMSK